MAEPRYGVRADAGFMGRHLSPGRALTVLLIVVSCVRPVGGQDIAFDFMLWDASGSAIHALVEDGMRGLESMPGAAASASADIASARQRFWQTYPDDPQHEAAARAFESALLGKDIHFLMMTLFREGGMAGEIVAGLGGSIDGGIPDLASSAFDDFARSYMEALNRRIDGRVTNLLDPRMLIGAWDDVQPAYRRYRLMRNVAEFDRAEVEPPMAESLQGWIALELKRYNSSTGMQFLAPALENMVQALGEEFGVRLLQRAKDAPKSYDGAFGPLIRDLNALGLSATPEEEPYLRRPHNAFLAMAERNGDPRQWAATRLAQGSSLGWYTREGLRQLERLEWAYGAEELAAILESVREQAAEGGLIRRVREAAVTTNPLGTIRHIWVDELRPDDLTEAEASFAQTVEMVGGMDEVLSVVSSDGRLSFDRLFIDAIPTTRLGPEDLRIDPENLPRSRVDEYQILRVNGRNSGRIKMELRPGPEWLPRTMVFEVTNEDHAYAGPRRETSLFELPSFEHRDFQKSNWMEEEPRGFRAHEVRTGAISEGMILPLVLYGLPLDAPHIYQVSAYSGTSRFDPPGSRSHTIRVLGLEEIELDGRMVPARRVELLSGGKEQHLWIDLVDRRLLRVDHIGGSTLTWEWRPEGSLFNDGSPARSLPPVSFEPPVTPYVVEYILHSAEDEPIGEAREQLTVDPESLTLVLTRDIRTESTVRQDTTVMSFELQPLYYSVYETDEDSSRLLQLRASQDRSSRIRFTGTERTIRNGESAETPVRFTSRSSAIFPTMRDVVLGAEELRVERSILLRVLGESDGAVTNQRFRIRQEVDIETGDETYRAYHLETRGSVLFLSVDAPHLPLGRLQQDPGNFILSSVKALELAGPSQEGR